MPWLLPIAAFALPLVLTFAPKGTVALMMVLAVGGAAESVRQRCLPLPPRAVLAAMAAVLAWGALSSLWQVTPGLALSKAGQLLGLLGGGVLALGSAAYLPPARRGAVLTGLVAGVALVATIMVEERLTNLKLREFLHTVRGIPIEIHPWVEMYMYKTAAAVSGVIAVPALGAAIARRWWPGIVALLLSVPAMALVTGSLACLAAFSIGVVLLLLGRRRASALVAAAVLTGFLVAPVAAHLPTTAEISSRVSLPLSALHRTIIWRFAAGHVAERPVLGWGLDASRELPGGDATEMMTVPAGYSFPQPVLPLHPHNMFIQVWLEIGAVGAALMAVMLLLVVRASSGLDGPAVPAMGAALLVSGASFGAWQSWWLAVVWILAALVIALRRDPA